MNLCMNRLLVLGMKPQLIGQLPVLQQTYAPFTKYSGEWNENWGVLYKGMVRSLHLWELDCVVSNHGSATY